MQIYDRIAKRSRIVQDIQIRDGFKLWIRLKHCQMSSKHLPTAVYETGYFHASSPINHVKSFILGVYIENSRCHDGRILRYLNVMWHFKTTPYPK